MKITGKYLNVFDTIISINGFLLFSGFVLIAFWYETQVIDSPVRLAIYVTINSYLMWQSYISLTNIFFVYHISCLYPQLRFDQINDKRSCKLDVYQRKEKSNEEENEKRDEKRKEKMKKTRECHLRTSHA